MTGARFIVLEGGDGCGKSTQARLLAAALRREGLEVVQTFEPGATPLGSAIRELVLHSRSDVTPLAEALLMAADRAQHVVEQIRPALDRGEWVVCDRYVPSSLVYQGVVRGLGIDRVRDLNQAALDDAPPDRVVLLDVPDDLAAGRVNRARDRLEAEGDEFHRAVREAYRTLARDQGWVIVEGSGTPEAVGARVWSAIADLLPG